MKKGGRRVRIVHVHGQQCQWKYNAARFSSAKLFIRESVCVGGGVEEGGLYLESIYARWDRRVISWHQQP